MKKIVILHGWAYSLEKWVVLIRILEKKGFSVNFLNIPGLTAVTNKVWTLGKYVAWLSDQLKGHKGKVILVGHSNGGRIAIAYAAKYGNKLEQLILIDSAGIYHNEWPIRLKRFGFKIITGIGKKITSSARARKFIYKLARESDYEKASPLMKKTIINLISTELRPIMDKINVPTLIIWGKQDKITPFSDALMIKEHIKESRLFVIDKAGHSPFFDQPGKVSKIIQENV